MIYVRFYREISWEINFNFFKNLYITYIYCCFRFVLLLLLFINDIRQSTEILIFYIDNEEISVFDIMQSIEILLFDNFHISPHPECKIY